MTAEERKTRIFLTLKEAFRNKQAVFIVIDCKQKRLWYTLKKIIGLDENFIDAIDLRGQTQLIDLNLIMQVILLNKGNEK